MDYSKFLSYFRSIEIDNHILKGRREVEENIKIKIIVPLLQYLGWDLLDDVDFEYMGAGIVIHNKDKPLIIVETKSWDEVITDHLDQSLAYSYKLKTPLVIVTTGQQTALYCCLLANDNLADTKPIFSFTFDELTDTNGQILLEKLYVLLGKESFANSHKELNSIIEKYIGNKSLIKAQNDFIEKASEFKSEIKFKRLTEAEFIELAENHAEEIKTAIMQIYRKILKLTTLNDNLNLRYRSKEIGIQYHLYKQYRNKIIGLFGIYPKSAHVAFGLEGWRQLNIAESTLKELIRFPRKVQSLTWAEQLGLLLQKAIEEISEI
jgi:hypothetical protein